jgi:hypothetical protein
VRKWRGWEEMKNAEQWCFSIGKTDERLRCLVGKMKNEQWCFSNGKENAGGVLKMKGWCFSNGKSCC